MTSVIERYQACAQLLREADGLIITAGAGMGVDSGLPDFRGNEGFWKHYPALGEAGLHFDEIANPQQFRLAPERAWGFYGHRFNLYRDTVPHEGFHRLLEIGRTLPRGYFVYTSNVDGQFQKAGFDPLRVQECHGSIRYLQCFEGCSKEVWEVPFDTLDVDEPQCLLRSTLPTCPRCGGLARPNILMFGDGDWHGQRAQQQQIRFHAWRQSLKRPVVIELGAGMAIPTVRLFGMYQECPLIRVNTTDISWLSERDIGLQVGAREAVEGIYAASREQPAV